MAKLIALSALIADYPAVAPQSLDELADTDFETLRSVLDGAGVDEQVAQKVFELRRHGRDVRQASDLSATLTSAQKAIEAVAAGLLKPPADTWALYPLDGRKRRVSAPHKKGGSKFVVKTARKLPEPEELPEVPADGSLLIAWGGSPDVLAIPGVAQRLDRVARHVRVVDVLFKDTDAGQLPAIHSLLVGKGLQGDTVLDFPDLDALKTARRSFDSL